MRISKWKAGIWFASAATVIFAPIGLIIGKIIENQARYTPEVMSPAQQQEMISGIAGAIIGYALCVILAIVLYKSEKKRCNNNKAHMKLFVKIGFQGYLKFLFFALYIWFWLVGKLLGVDKAVAMKKRKYPEYVQGSDGESYNILTNASNEPYIYVNGKTRNLRDMGGYYQDDYGETYSYDNY